MPTSSEHRKRVSRAGAPNATLLGKLQRPPFARVQRVQLIRREIREYLPKGSIDVLFSSAEQVVEGSTELDLDRAGAQVAGRVFATVMVTIDLQQSQGYFRELADDATAARVAELMQAEHLQGGREVHDKLVEIARPKLAELAGVAPNDLQIAIELELRAEGAKILIDADAMGSPRRRGRR